MQPIVCDDLGHQPDALGTSRVDHLTGHREASGHRQADELGEACGHAAAGQDADARVRVGEHRALRGDHEVAAERHLQAAGEHRPVDRADDRGVHLRSGLDAALRAELREVLTPVTLRLLQIHTRAEGGIGSGEHDRAHRFVGIGLGQRGIRSPDQGAAQRISRLGSIERQHPHRALVGDEDKHVYPSHTEIDVMVESSRTFVPRRPFGRLSASGGTGWRCSPGPAAAAAMRRART